MFAGAAFFFFFNLRITTKRMEIKSMASRPTELKLKIEKKLNNQYTIRIRLILVFYFPFEQF